jgi:hypothetical protein
MFHESQALSKPYEKKKIAQSAKTAERSRNECNTSWSLHFDTIQNG